MTGSRRRLLVGLAVAVALVVVYLVLPSGVRWIVIVAVGALVLVNLVTFLWGARTARDASAVIFTAHPGETVLRTALLELEASTRAERDRVIAVLVDRGGLSFRDRSDAEVLRVPADRIMSIDLAPLDPRSALRPVRAALVDGPPVAFWVGNQPEQQVDAVVAIRTALGRSD